MIRPNSTHFHIISLGCSKNQVDSEHLVQHLNSYGFTDAGFDNAEVLLINTCSFIEDAKKESVEAIFEAVSTGKPVVVLGCLSKRYQKELIREVPEVNHFFGVGQTDEIVRVCHEITGKAIVAGACKTSVRQRLNPSHYAYLKIADGCSRVCSYCVIPSIRGPYRSVDQAVLVQEAQALAQDGVKELILVAQETTYYGRDLNAPEGLCGLLKELSGIDELVWIRTLYAHPASINEELVKVMAQTQKIVPYLDIPLQHSDRKILKAMNRQGSAKDYLNLLRLIRSHIPDVVIRTTMIVGFPGESEQQFQGLLDFVQEAEFDRLGVFSYSCEEGTKAARMRRQVSESVCQERMEQLMAVQAEISLKKNRLYIGTVQDVIIDEINENNDSEVKGIGRTCGQTPEVDGLTIVKACHGELRPGQIVKVKITGASEYDLEGILAGAPFGSVQGGHNKDAS